MPYQFIYPDYLDGSTGKTLVATPGSTYTVVLAPGRSKAAPSVPGDGRWPGGSPGIVSLGEAAAEPEPAPAPEQQSAGGAPDRNAKAGTAGEGAGA